MGIQLQQSNCNCFCNLIAVTGHLTALASINCNGMGPFSCFSTARKLIKYIPEGFGKKKKKEKNV